MQSTEMRQLKDNQNIVASYIIYLLTCALHNNIPSEKPLECSWGVLYDIAKKNNVDSTISPAIQNYEYDIPEEIAKSWKAAKNMTLYRQLRFDMEREEILRKMEENGISYLLLKGILVANYYPIPGMRWFCDNDILYGYVEPNSNGGYRFKGNSESEQKQGIHVSEEVLCSVMEKLGYTAEHIGGTHDAYYKAPFFNFELHHRLVNPQSEAEAYYRNPWERALQQENNPLRYYFSDEDEYIYLITHAHKHFSHAGCGIRTLVDEYVILQKKTSMNWNYIRDELKLLKLDTFEIQLREAALHAFSEDEQPTEEEWNMIYFMLGCGTYGTLENRVNQKLEEIQKAQKKGKVSARWKYVKERFVLTEQQMEDAYPFFYKHKIFRMVLPTYRTMRGFCKHPRILLEEFRVWKKF